MNTHKRLLTPAGLLTVGLVAGLTAGSALAAGKFTITVTCDDSMICTIKDPVKDIKDTNNDKPIKKTNPAVPPKVLLDAQTIVFGAAVDHPEHSHPPYAGEKDVKVAAPAKALKDGDLNGRHCWVQVGGQWYSVHC